MATPLQAPQRFQVLAPAQLISDLHEVLAKAETLRDVSSILAVYVRHIGCFGAVLWQEAEGVGPNGKGRLFVQAQYFRGQKRPPFYHLPMNSVSGQCVSSGSASNHSRINGEWEGVRVHHPKIMDSWKLTAFCTIPIVLRGLEERKTKAALTFYRTDGAFSSEEFSYLKDVSTWFPTFYRSIHDRVSLQLRNSVHEMLKSVQHPDATNVTSEKADDLAKKTLLSVLELTAEQFQVAEAVIYLSNPAKPDVFRFNLMASIWPWEGSQPLPYYYRGDGATGWVLANRKPLVMVDMNHYAEDSNYYKANYLGMKWEDRFRIKDQARRYLEISSSGDTPPLSYACVPIEHQGKVLGALRCCVSQNGPFHLDPDCVTTLKAVASVIASWWGHWTHFESSSTDYTPAIQAIQQLTLANAGLLQQIETSRPNLAEIAAPLEAVIRATCPIDLMELWQYRSHTGEWVLASSISSISHEPEFEIRGSSKRIPKRDAFLYVLEGNGSLNVDRDASPFEVFKRPTLKTFAVVPIGSRPNVLGVALIGSRTRAHYPKGTLSILGFVASQVAIYWTAMQQIDRLGEANKKVEGSMNEQLRLLRDFEHQLRTPIGVAAISLEDLKNVGVSKEQAEVIDALEGAVRKCKTVASNLKFFADLASGRNAKPHMTIIDPCVFR